MTCFLKVVALALAFTLFVLRCAVVVKEDYRGWGCRVSIGYQKQKGVTSI